MTNKLFIAHIKVLRFKAECDDDCPPTRHRTKPAKTYTSSEKIHGVWAKDETEVKEKLDKFYSGKDAALNARHEVLIKDIEETIE